jgi:hypothetical protein
VSLQNDGFTLHERYENMVAAASNDISVTRPTKHFLTAQLFFTRMLRPLKATAVESKTLVIWQRPV